MTDNNRKTISQRLQSLPWFKDSSQEIQQKILSLPDDFLGYLDDLSQRQDEVGDLDILRLANVFVGQYLVTSIFDVRSTQTNQEFTYEYVSWKYGAYTGMRCIIFLESEDRITHFLVAKKDRFSSASEALESIGGFFFKIENNRSFNLPKSIENEILFHLGLSEIKFSRVVDLGKVFPDLGMTNNSSSLVAAIINIDNIPQEIVKNDFRTSHKMLNFETRIAHINEFPDYINKISDGYFLAAAARILVSPKIHLEF